MRRWWILWAAALLCLGGCSSEEWLEVLIDDTDIREYPTLERLVVTVGAGNDVGMLRPESCQPREREFVASGGLDFPISIVFLQSESDWDCIALDVVGFHEGQPVIHTEELYCDWADSRSVTLPLLSACDLRSPAGPPNCDDNAAPVPTVCQNDDGVPRCFASRVAHILFNEEGGDRACDSVE